MGAWGHGIFQNDSDLDIAQCDISDDAKKAMGYPELDLTMPRNRVDVVSKLNAGVFSELLDQYKVKRSKYNMVFLAALSMQLGVIIPKKDMKIIRAAFRRVEFMGKEQMAKALKEYNNNGEGWDFESPGLIETMIMKTDDERYDAKKDFCQDPESALPVPGRSVPVEEMEEEDERMKAWWEERDAAEKEYNEKKEREANAKQKHDGGQCRGEGGGCRRPEAYRAC